MILIEVGLCDFFCIFGFGGFRMRVQRGLLESNERWVSSEHPSTESRSNCWLGEIYERWVRSG